MKTLDTPKAVKRHKPPKRQTSIRIDAEVYAEASKLAEADKRNFSQYVELALEFYNQQQKALAQYFKSGAAYPVFTPYGQEAAAAKLTELLKGRSE
jgi:hypothetical protein